MSSVSGAADAVPKVDLTDFADPSLRDGFVKALGSALVEYGFVRVTGHQVGPALTQPAYDVSRDFFALSEAEKLRFLVPGGAGERGYTPFGAEHAKDTPVPDLKEFWHTGRELPPEHPRARLYPRNQWPDDVVPGFRTAMLGLYGALERCAETLLQAIALYLGLPADQFTSLTEHGNTILRALHYPALDGVPRVPGAVRAAAHEDINFITLLVTSTASGLQILRRDGTWLPVDAEDGEIVADAGDMLARITNQAIAATTHRVVNPDDGRGARFSMPLFVHPRPDAVLSVPPACRGPGWPPAPPDITGHEFLHQRLAELGLVGSSGPLNVG
jgi:isopenicillin N synthase-like dioxygenase